MTSEELFPLLTAALALCTAYATVMTAVRAFREERSRRAEPTETLRASVRAQDARLDRLEARADGHDEALRLLLRAQLALLRHGEDGEDTEALRACQSEIERYLLNR